jgi:hypothetical protein
MSDDTQIGYDIIGDVHGHADKLEGLLRKMDYELIDGTWQHPERKVIFVGDLIDRGPRQIDSVMIAKRMVEGGHAHIVMGNHEFNAIAYATPNPNKPGDFLRTHEGEWAAKNFAQHQKFLEAFVLEQQQSEKGVNELIDMIKRVGCDEKNLYYLNKTFKKNEERKAQGLNPAGQE